MNEAAQNKSSVQRSFLEDFVTSDEFRRYMEANGFQYASGKNSDSYKWIRRHPVEYDDNFVTYEDLSSQLIEWLRKEWQKVPGNEAERPLSIEGYNTFAKNDEWKGGFVEQLGFVGIASSSSYPYGQPLYYGSSWVRQGSDDTTAISSGKFYRLKNEATWKGGHVSTWGYVNESTNILGASASTIKFVKGNDSERELVNIANLIGEISYQTGSVSSLKSVFADSWDKTTQSYRIDDVALRNYLNKNFYASTISAVNNFTGVIENLKKHQGIILRQVTQTEIKNGSTVKYGRDYLIVGYNIVKQVFYYISPITGEVGTINADDIRTGKWETILFAYNHLPK